MEEKLKQLLLEIAPELDLSNITPETRLYDDLGMNSITGLMMVLEMEEEFQIEIDESVQFETVGDVYDYLRDRM